MISVPELKAWLETLDESSGVGIDDGGLTLVEVNAAGEETEAYLEVGGTPNSAWGDGA